MDQESNMQIRSADILGAYLVVGPSVNGPEVADAAVVRALCNQADFRFVIRDKRQEISKILRKVFRSFEATNHDCGWPLL